jgi:hypothetical protein
MPQPQLDQRAAEYDWAFEDRIKDHRHCIACSAGMEGNRDFAHGFLSNVRLDAGFPGAGRGEFGSPGESTTNNQHDS